MLYPMQDVLLPPSLGGFSNCFITNSLIAPLEDYLRKYLTKDNGEVFQK